MGKLEQLYLIVGTVVLVLSLLARVQRMARHVLVPINQEGTPMASWSDKDERQYEKIKESSQKRGVSDKRAKEIAARTVNKERRREDRTPSRRTQGRGNPNRPLEDRTRDELYNRAKELHIEGRSKMTKEQLLQAIRQAA